MRRRLTVIASAGEDDAVGRAAVNGVELEYEVLGDLSDPVLLLVGGLGAQLVSWDDDFCSLLRSLGLAVIRFDNRDVGRSTLIDDPRDPVALLGQRLGGEDVAPPYRIADMADDAAALLGALDVEAAHVLGSSMGGMISQALAIAHPDRVLTLTSVMSTTGDRSVGKADPKVFGAMMAPTPTDTEEAIAHRVALSAVMAGPSGIDEVRARRRATLEQARAADPRGVVRQLLGVVSSPPRTDALAGVGVPTLVIHGDADPVIDLSGGRQTADAVPGAELLVLEGVGHELPERVWPTVIDRLEATMGRASSRS